MKYFLGLVLPASTSVDTFGGKIHIEWDAEAPVTPMGQLPFFIQFIKLGGRFAPWVKVSNCIQN